MSNRVKTETYQRINQPIKTCQEETNGYKKAGEPTTQLIEATNSLPLRPCARPGRNYLCHGGYLVVRQGNHKHMLIRQGNHKHILQAHTHAPSGSSRSTKKP